jgi:F0F1-type ATP synthase alpha subunit
MLARAFPRVGGKTRSQAMRKLSEKLPRYAQFLELEIFTASAEMVDDRTRQIISMGGASPRCQPHLRRGQSRFKWPCW